MSTTWQVFGIVYRTSNCSDLTFNWEQVSGPEAITIDDITALSPNITAPTGALGDYVLRFTVTENGNTASAEVTTTLISCT